MRVNRGLPGYNCQKCGYSTCNDLAKSNKLDKCPFYKTVPKHSTVVPDDRTGVIDGLKADFRLKPLKGEPSCREFIMPLQGGDPSVKLITRGDIIKYRPLGCPITHFAKVIEDYKGFLEVHIIGPTKQKYYNIGLCMVLGFIGIVDGTVPKVSQTVKFIPDKCMMSKVHSSVVVQVEGRKVRLEGVDLKVWEHAK